jgi:predicted Zn finger-like uncharacterized protein
MSVIDERIAQDLQKLTNLSKQTNGRVRVMSVSGKPAKRIDIELSYPTAPTRDYPKRIQSTTALKIELMSRYPFVEPSAVITTPIFHPNVFASGKICLGAKWLPTQGLDLLVRRVIQIITFDPDVLNERSPANGVAVDWYRSALRANPEAFPTIRKEGSASAQPVQESVILQCPSCEARLRIPSGKSGEVSCPKCSQRFSVSS